VTCAIIICGNTKFRVRTAFNSGHIALGRADEAAIVRIWGRTARSGCVTLALVMAVIVWVLDTLSMAVARTIDELAFLYDARTRPFIQEAFCTNLTKLA